MWVMAVVWKMLGVGIMWYVPVVIIVRPTESVGGVDS